MPELHDIDVQVTRHYLRDESDPDAQRFVFAYTVQLENRGSVAARLLSRHWTIIDADGNEEEVRGSGVVGEHPYLRPGERYQYTSGTVLSTPLGFMHGSYRMRDDEGNVFDAPIPIFQLSAEVVFH